MDEAEKILKGKYPAKAHVAKVVDYLKKNSSVHGVIYLEGQKTRMFEDSDEAMPFRYGRHLCRTRTSNDSIQDNGGTFITCLAATYRTPALPTISRQLT